MSDDWSEGYVTEIDYTWGFHKELAPTNLAWVAALRGHTPPGADEPFRYIELGCGNGLSLNVFAASHPQAEFVGVDFNPSHVANGRRTAERGGIKNVRFVEKSFAELTGDGSLGEFDYVVLHGIWSWVSAENRAHIVSFIKAHLKAGGLVYVSFNALPGWSEMMAVRRMMLDTASRTQGDIEAKVKAAVSWLKKYWDTQNKSSVTRSYKNRIERILKSDVAYLAHEYFNKDWTLFFFEDVAAELRQAKLSFLSTATLEQTEAAYVLTREQLALAREVKDLVDREQMKDFLADASFRRDVYLRGTPRAEWARDPSQSPAFGAQVVGPRRSNHQFEQQVKVPVGTMSFAADHEKALFELFKKGPMTVGETFDPMWAEGRTNAMVATTLRQMVACDLLRPWARKPSPAKHDTSSRFRFALPFNEQLVSDTITGQGRRQLVAGVNAGTGIGINIREAYMLSCIVEAGLSGAVAAAHKKLETLQKRLIIDGRPLNGRKEHDEELTRELDRFRRYKLEHFVRLGVLEVSG